MNYQVYKHGGNVHDGRYLTRNSDGSARWTLTRGDANFYTKAEAKKVAAHYNRVFIGHTLMVVPEGVNPWEGKPETYGWNPRGKKSRARKAPRKARGRNPAAKTGECIIVAVDKRQGQVRYWKGMEWGLKREWAARWGTKEMARSAAMDVTGIKNSQVAVVPYGMPEAKIREALLGSKQ